MADKPIRLRTLAAADLEDAASYDRDKVDEQTALGFIDEVQAAFGMISSSPGIGSLRYSYDLDIPGLRAFPIKRFAHAAFYAEADDVVDVWRILHTRRDMVSTRSPRPLPPSMLRSWIEPAGVPPCRSDQPGRLPPSG